LKENRACGFSVWTQAIEIHHPPWPLQVAEAEFERNTMAEQLGISLTTRLLLHFAKRQDVIVWRPEVAG